MNRGSGADLSSYRFVGGPLDGKTNQTAAPGKEYVLSETAALVVAEPHNGIFRTDDSGEYTLDSSGVYVWRAPSNEPARQT